MQLGNERSIHRLGPCFVGFGSMEWDADDANTKEVANTKGGGPIFVSFYEYLFRFFAGRDARH
jgi:hypothetical protein